MLSDLGSYLFVIQIPFQLFLSLLLVHITTAAMANTGTSNMVRHPLQATADAIGKAGGDPRTNRASLFMGANEGPAEIASKISGFNLASKREDDSHFFTNNDGHPLSDP